MVRKETTPPPSAGEKVAGTTSRAQEMTRYAVMLVCLSLSTLSPPHRAAVFPDSSPAALFSGSGRAGSALSFLSSHGEETVVPFHVSIPLPHFSGSGGSDSHVTRLGVGCPVMVQSPSGCLNRPRVPPCRSVTLGPAADSACTAAPSAPDTRLGGGGGGGERPVGRGLPAGVGLGSRRRAVEG